MRPRVKQVLIICGVAVCTGLLGFWLAKWAHSLHAPDLKGYHTDRLEFVPEQAIVVVSFDVGWALEVIIEKNLGLGKSTNADETKEALTEASEEHLGIDVMAARRGVLWVSEDDDVFAAFIEGEFEGEIEGVRDDEQGDYVLVRLKSGMWVCMVEGGLVLGTKKGVEASLDALGGDDALSEKAIERHKAVLDEIGDGPLVVSIDFKNIDRKPPRWLRGLRAFAIALEGDGSVSAAASGKERTLEKLVNKFEDAEAEAEEGLEKEAERAENRGHILKLLTIAFAQGKLSELFAAANLEHDGEILKSKIEGPNGWIGVALFGATFGNGFTRKKSERAYPADYDEPY